MHSKDTELMGPGKNMHCYKHRAVLLDVNIQISCMLKWSASNNLTNALHCIWKYLSLVLMRACDLYGGNSTECVFRDFAGCMSLTHMDQGCQLENNISDTYWQLQAM